MQDFDSDGVVDFAATAQGDSETFVFIVFLHSDGTVKRAVSHPVSGTDSAKASVIAFHDVDRNGVPDLLVSSDDSTSITMLLLESDGLLSDSTLFSVAYNGASIPGGFGASLAIVGDLDGDGLPAFVVGYPTAGEGEVWTVEKLEGSQVRFLKLSYPPLSVRISGLLFNHLFGPQSL